MMKTRIGVSLFFMCLLVMTNAVGQSFKQKDVIVSTIITDDFSGRYNVGLEYFTRTKFKDLESARLSISVNGGVISTTIKGQQVIGYNIVTEANLYSEILLSEKWNEYGGVKLSYGNFNNKTLNNTKTQFFFAGISTGFQPVIAKLVTVKVSTDLGYMKNGLANQLLMQTSNGYLYSGFAILFNLGVGLKLGRR